MLNIVKKAHSIQLPVTKIKSIIKKNQYKDMKKIYTHEDEKKLQAK